MFVVSPHNQPGAFVPFVLVPIVAAVAAVIIGMPILWLSLRAGLRRFWQISLAGFFGGVLAGQLFVMGSNSTRAYSSMLQSVWDLRFFAVLGAAIAAIHWVLISGALRSRVAASIAVLFAAEATFLLDVHFRLGR